MIIQIRGTSGSGKTTVMRSIMSALGSWEPQYVDRRKQPLYYHRDRKTIVLGHYESTCGGCDNIGSARQVFLTLQKVVYESALCEGLLLSEDTKWTLQMLDVRVLFLVTDIEECIRRVKKRRKDAGNDKPLNEKNTRNRVATIERARVKLTEAGVYCRRATVEQAPKIILNWLGYTRAKGSTEWTRNKAGSP